MKNYTHFVPLKQEHPHSFNSHNYATNVSTRLCHVVNWDRTSCAFFRISPDPKHTQAYITPTINSGCNVWRYWHTAYPIRTIVKKQMSTSQIQFLTF